MATSGETEKCCNRKWAVVFNRVCLEENIYAYVYLFKLDTMHINIEEYLSFQLR